MRLFVDSSAWTALYNPRDKYRLQARDGMQALAGQDAEFVTTDYVLDETLTDLQTGYMHTAAERFGVWVQKQANVRVVHVSESIWADAWEMFRRSDDKEFSFTDCISFVVMQQQDLHDAFTFDHHFEQMGFRPWPR